MKFWTFLLTLIVFQSFGQTLTKFALKCGPTISGISGPPGQLGLASSCEVSLITFGKKKRTDFNIDLSFLQKGGQLRTTINTTDQPDGVLGIGYLAHIKYNYLSLCPSVKFNLTNYFFLKVGPRMDYLLNYYFKGDPFSYKDYSISRTTLGLTYSLGFIAGKKRVKFIYELLGQNDFTPSVYNTKDKGKNYAIINYFGLLINLKSD